MGRETFFVAIETVLVLHQMVVTGIAARGSTTMMRRDVRPFHCGVSGSPGSLVLSQLDRSPW